MLDPKTLKVGSVVKLTGKILDLDGVNYQPVVFDGARRGESTSISIDELGRGELVSHPEPTFTKEQCEFISAFLGKNTFGAIAGGG